MRSSKFEKEMIDKLDKKFGKNSRVAAPVHYVSFHKYTADRFIYIEIGNKGHFVEVKGFFRTSAEARKYVDISKSLKHNETLVFIFQKPDQKMLGYKNQTFRQWAEKNNFEVWEL